ncbi:ribokinase [Agrobacterium larrymoorei]|uniref:Ribokinase n=1 Tax=Agrobacterium larrymoorei TaxID=160699 RepID=A0AAJ2EUR7_9HYPH|nr:carbohydrate kinase family protein [Agrobacterium larrymoorei]MDR6101727.1 ribokinase [Agrobacterium larrymoorei]
MSRYLFVGDISLDLSMSAPHVPAPDEKVHCSAISEAVGGVVTNTAVAFLKAGGSPTLVTQLGDDLASRSILAHMSEYDLDFCPAMTPGALCRVVTILEPHGEKRLLLYPGVSIFPHADVISDLDLSDIAHIHTSFFGPAAHGLVERARSANLPWSIDLEPATFSSGIDALADALLGASVVFVNDRAAAALGDDPVAKLNSMGAQTIIRSRGAEGAELHQSGIVISARPPLGVPIIDTTGAGDCLAGWFLAGQAASWAPEVIIRRAVIAATLSCRSVGAQSGYPSLEEVKNYSVNTEEIA